MFGLFKKKINKDDQFAIDLVIFNSAIRSSVNSITDEISKFYCKEVLDIYVDGTFKTSSYSASDSYLNELIRNASQVTLDGVIRPKGSWVMYNDVENFLKFNSQYNSEIVIEGMDLWYKVLVKVGAFEQ